MKNNSLSVMIHGFPKLGTVLDYGIDYNICVIGYENQMSIIDLLYLRKGKMFLLKTKYVFIINAIYLNKNDKSIEQNSHVMATIHNIQELKQVI